MAKPNTAHFAVGLMAWLAGLSLANEATVIEEVIVTAQKRAENIRDVPISITALSEDFINDVGITDIGELSQFAPNLVINATPYTGFVAMRGLGSGNNKGFERSVALVIDGVYYGRQDYLFEALTDAQRVEVLRGPQGTLFGKNAIAGALNVTTGQASREFTGKVSWLGGDFDRRRFQAAIGGPLIDNKIHFRLALENEYQQGVIKNTTADLNRADYPQVQDIDDHMRSRDNDIKRLKLHFPSLAQGLDINLTATDTSVFGNSTGTELTAATPATLEVYRRYDPNTEADKSNQTSSQNANQDTLREGTSFTLQADYELGEYAFTAVAGTSEFDKVHILDADFGPAEIVLLTGDDTYEQNSLELRLASPPGALEYVAGLYYFESDYFGLGTTDLETAQTLEVIAAVRGSPATLNELLNIAATTPLPADDRLNNFRYFDQQTESAAIFGQATWNLSDQLALIAGSRYSEETKDVHAILSHNSFVAERFFAQFLFEEPYNENRSRKETDFSPKLSVRYEMNDEVTFYATWAKAFKAGGFNEAAVSADNLEFEPENAETYEAGTKMRLLNGAATLNIGLFSTDFDNLQVSLFNGTNFSVGNAASARSRGVEIESQLLPAPWLALNVSLAYLDSRYDKFPDAQCTATSGESACDLSGKRLTRAPEWEATLVQRWNLTQLIPGLNDLPFSLGLGVDATFRDHQFFSTDLDPIDAQGPTTEMNANLRVSSLDDNWSVTLLARNITRREIQAHGQDVPLQPGSHFGTMNALDRYFVEFLYRW
ncbi:TonB-dependent receptor [Litorivivens sp.]|uniref:TonB-dependent receptor n=1 Tax=Litorivivens sp. TaxID=2020868 RepID=UPI00356AEEF7